MLASKGKINPLVNQLRTAKKTNAKPSLMILTESEPTFFVADSKESAVIVQQKAVNKAANSPECEENDINNLYLAAKITFNTNKQLHRT